MITFVRAMIEKKQAFFVAVVGYVQEIKDAFFTNFPLLKKGNG